ncbi:MAG: two-component system LytT family response regulator [Saprospiraceae bacterium]|jgi:two-component system LytT family response regulator
MKKAILIDDEHYCNKTLEFELKRSAYEIEVVAKCIDSRNAKSLIEEYKPDIVFMDIEMPWLSGFEVLDSIENIDFHLVFVTAYDQFALKAFHYFALNYLLKPVDKNALEKTLQKIMGATNIVKNEMSEVLQTFSRSRTNNDLIALPLKGGYEFFKKADIIRCESDSNYCTIYFEDKRSILVSKPLAMIEDMLDDRFFRVHQSHLINTLKLKRLDKSDGASVELNDGSIVPISRLKKSEFFKFVI